MIYEELNGKFNIGDYIQSLAAKQFLPNVDSLISRERLGSYTGEKSKIILNGWFTHRPETWIPSKQLQPLFISFHINSSAASRILSPEGIQYLKQHEPIGCRDYYTLQLLQEKGVSCYFSGCLTTTLSSYASTKKNENIYIVDPLYGFPNKDRIFSTPKSFVKAAIGGDLFQTHSVKNYMKQIFSDDILNRAKYIKHEIVGNKLSESDKFELADKLLNKYAQAQLVITSRIHCALPCLAMNTPVIYLNGFESEFDACRMEGLSQLFNTINVNRKSGEVSSNFSYDGLIDDNTTVPIRKEHVVLADAMKKSVRNFIEK